MGFYRKRIIDSLLERKLHSIGAVLIEGPKLCGKTTSAEHAARSVLYMANPDVMKSNIQLASIQPSILLKGETPRLIDEWQIAPNIWDAVRFEVDHRNECGQFILTGSAAPTDRSKIFHSGTGRISWLKMRTMSLFESGESSGAVSLSELFDGAEISGTNPTDDVEQLSYLCCRGGWPTTLDLQKDYALNVAEDYVRAIEEVDISRVDNVRRNVERTRRLMKSYARSIGTQVSNETIRKDMLTNDTDSLSVDTVVSYINALKKIFVIEDMPAWNPNIRSKTAIRTSDTRYFSDPSIACAVLGLGPDELLSDLKTFGFIFESMCVRDLRVYADANEAQVYHYRDKSGLECDAVIHLRDGRYGLVEIKLGGEDNIAQGIKTLKKLADTIDTSKMKAPSFLMVLIGKGTYAFRRNDGVYVVPLSCLKE
ncbi:MAG: ATP-binding protein [Succinivibrio sp.]|nr:ATP-binding protein [Succinivibrio sp.]